MLKNSHIICRWLYKVYFELRGSPTDITSMDSLGGLPVVGMKISWFSFVSTGVKDLVTKSLKLFVVVVDLPNDLCLSTRNGSNKH